jgi:hypothetical protein
VRESRFQCIHDRRVAAAVSGYDQAEPTARFLKNLPKTFVLEAKFIGCVLETPRPKISMQFDFNWPALLIDGLLGYLRGVESHGG